MPAAALKSFDVASTTANFRPASGGNLLENQRTGLSGTSPNKNDIFVPEDHPWHE